jgi:hypothetical protein
VEVALYNSAGEEVRELFQGGAQGLPGGISLSSPAGSQLYQIGQGQLLVSAGGSVLATWNGDNANGQAVQSGSYYFKVEYQDPFGQVTSFIQTVQVLQGRGADYLAVYNSAGEEVAREDFSGRALAVSDFSLAKGTYALVYSAAGADLDPVLISTVDSSGARGSFSWNGRNSEGRPLASGTYFLKLVDVTAAGTLTVTHQVTLVQGGDPGLAFEPILAPNPAPLEGLPGRGRFLAVVYPVALASARAQLYDLNGANVAGAGDPGGTGRIWLGYQGLAAGIYFVELSGTLATGAPYRHILKAAVIR